MLVDDLLDAGYRHVTVLDIAEPALVVSRVRLGDRAGQVDWRVGDVTTVAMPEALHGEFGAGYELIAHQTE